MSTLRPELWRQAERLFEVALDQAPAGREALLERVCGADRELRDAVDALLAAHAESDGPFDDPWAPPPALGGSDAEPEPPLPPLGPYRLLHRIGQGGLCDVYLAERADEAPGPKVAVKVLRSGRRQPGMLRRMRVEREVLAQLDHPHIARLLDGGSTPAGDPYVVMEYVPGTPITRYCDLRRLTVRARIELFRSVCAAVQHAHQRLVVHRDVKPGNILVTDEGQPKLLDFGIAKWLTAAGSREHETDTLERLLTPDYASPEQLAGGQITTATDVYSLGVLLHELLTGRPSLRWTHQAPEELLARLRQEEKRLPSAVVAGRDLAAGVEPSAVAEARSTTPAQLRRELSGDLDNIILRALSPEPARRYPSVERLSDDLGRYLAGLPVQARGPGLAYRAVKFVRRNRAAVAAAAVAAVAAAGLFASAMFQSARVARERDLARAEERRAEEVTAFLVSAFEVSDPSEARGATVTAREVLDRGASRVERELSGEPLLQAALMDAMGKVYMRLGLLDSARPLLQGALQRRLSAYGPAHLDVAASQTHLALLLHQQEEDHTAESLFRSALETRRERLGGDHPDVAESLGYVGYALRDRGRLAEAETLIRQALDLSRRQLGETHPRVAVIRMQLGILLEQKGDWVEGEASYREALAAMRQAHGDDHPDVASTLARLGSLAEARGQFAEAESFFREALAIRGRIIGTDRPVYADSLNDLANLLRHLARYDEAESLFRQILAIYRRRLGEGATLGTALANLGLVLREKGDPRAAEPLFREALALTRRERGGEDPDVAIHLSNLGLVLCDRGRYAEAQAALREALALRRRLLGGDHWTVGWTLAHLADARRAAGRPAEALGLAEEAAAIVARALPAGHWRAAVVAGIQGHCLAALGRYAEAEPVLARSVHALEASRGPRHFYTTRAAERLAALYGARRLRRSAT